MNVTECLAESGGSPSSVLMFVGIGLVLIGLGVLAIRSRKRTGTALGALALIGVLVLVPLASPSTAYAATGDCTTETSQPTSDPDPTFLTPGAPSTAAVCGAAPVLTTPASQYLTYTVSQAGSIATVTAAVSQGVAGYAIDPSAQTVWTIDLSFTPTTVLTAQSLAFTYDSLSTSARINDDSVATFLAAQNAALGVSTVSTLDYTYAVFTGTGDQIIELGETQQLTKWITNYSVVQNGQDLALTYQNSSYENGFEAAQAFFAAQGGVPAGAYIGIIAGGQFTSEALLTASYVNECDVAATVTAVTAF